MFNLALQGGVLIAAVLYCCIWNTDRITCALYLHDQQFNAEQCYS